MTIDTSGEFWTGDEPADIREYLEALIRDEGGYAVDEFRLARCGCGSHTFHLHADLDEGAARRTCTECGHDHFVCDSGEYWDECEPEPIHCPACDSPRTNIGVGFSLYDPAGDPRWLYLGLRCPNCGLLGCVADWKINTHPSHHILNQV